MFYTGKGDGGASNLFGSSKKLPKNSSVFEALGTLDELNSYLGVCKSGANDNLELKNILENIQHDLFIIQAELAGAAKTIEQKKVKKLEEKINKIEASLPSIHSFFLPGGSELGAKLDYARTIARRAERQVIGEKLGQFSLAYLNRLSSLLYALARLANQRAGLKEEAPNYK